MLLGSNRDEGSLFREQADYLADEEMFDGWLNATLGEELADELRGQKLYSNSTRNRHHHVINRDPDREIAWDYSAGDRHERARQGR